MRLNENGVIDVSGIIDLQKPCISALDRDKIQDLYNRLHEQKQNCAVHWYHNRLKNSPDIRKFGKAYFCINKGGLLKPFASVFVDRGEIRYRVIENHLVELGFSKEFAENLTLNYIYRPITSEENCGILLSVFSGINEYFHVLQSEISHNNRDRFVCVPINKEKTEKPSLANPVHVLDDGVVIIG